MQSVNHLATLPPDLTGLWLHVGGCSLADALAILVAGKAFNNFIKNLPVGAIDFLIENNTKVISLELMQRLVGDNSKKMRVLNIKKIDYATNPEAIFSIARQIEHMTKLNLNCFFKGDVIAALVPPHIVELNLSYTHMSVEALQRLLPTLDSIQTLDICDIAIDDQTLAALPHKANVRELSISSDRVSTGILPLLKNHFTGLEQLRIRLPSKEDYEALLNMKSSIHTFEFSSLAENFQKQLEASAAGRTVLISGSRRKPTFRKLNRPDGCEAKRKLTYLDSSSDPQSAQKRARREGPVSSENKMDLG